MTARAEEEMMGQGLEAGIVAAERNAREEKWQSKRTQLRKDPLFQEFHASLRLLQGS